MALPTIRRLVAVAATVVVLAMGVGGCARHEFADRSAVVTVGGSTQTYDVDSCGRDGQTVFVVARAPDGAVLQGVMGLRKDHKTAVARSTGMTLDLDPTSDATRIAAFGAESWTRRGSTGPAPGRITSARLRGSRIQFSGQAVSVDARDQPVPNGTSDHFSVDARCDEVDP